MIYTSLIYRYQSFCDIYITSLTLGQPAPFFGAESLRNSAAPSFDFPDYMLLVTAALTTTCFAQQNTYSIRVPFQFNIGSQKFPAGEYRVGVIQPGTVQLRGVDNTATAVVVSVPGGRAEQPVAKFVFHEYGEHHFLAQVCFDGIGVGYDLPKSKTEMETAKRVSVQNAEVLAQLHRP